MIRKMYKILFGLFLSIISSFSFAYGAVTFVSSYDNDGIASTNPQAGVPIRSYQIGSNYVFFAAVAVQAQGVSKGTQGTLTIWNSTTVMNFKTTAQDGGYMGFIVSAPYSSEGYYYKIDAAGQASEIRKIDINSQVSGRFDGVRINWDTADLSINSFPVTITAQADPAYSIANAGLSLGLGGSPVTVKGEITGGAIAFTLKDIPDGQYTAIVVAHTDRGIISSNPRKITISAGIQAPELNGGPEYVNGFETRLVHI